MQLVKGKAPLHTVKTKARHDCLPYLVEDAHHEDREGGVHDIVERDEVRVKQRLQHTQIQTLETVEY